MSGLVRNKCLFNKAFYFSSITIIIIICINTIIIIIIIIIISLLFRGAPTRHILPPSEIDLGLFWADFTDLEGKHIFHRIG